MDRIIEVKVNGHHLSKDNRVGGVQGEANVTALRIEFDEGWDGYAKTVTFYNALGENPVKRILTADLLEDITASTRIYLCYIPGEALTEAGWFEFVIDGYIDGKRQRSLSDQLEVKYAPIADNADEPVDPTPSQTEQIQLQIDTILDDMAEQAVIAHEAAAAAKLSEEDAKASAVESGMNARNAAASATEAHTYGSAAETSATNASKSATAAASSATAATNSASQAASSQKAAKTSADEAAESANLAETFSSEAAGSVSQVKTSETNAKASATAAAASASQAKTSETNAKAAASAAANHESYAEVYSMQAQNYSNNAWENAMVAESARKAAEKARDEAEQAVGGDFATKAYVDEAVANAGGDIDAGTF